jgi:hypothetical protein
MNVIGDADDNLLLPPINNNNNNNNTHTTATDSMNMNTEDTFDHHQAQIDQQQQQQQQDTTTTTQDETAADTTTNNNNNNSNNNSNTAAISVFANENPNQHADLFSLPQVHRHKSIALFSPVKHHSFRTELKNLLQEEHLDAMEMAEHHKLSFALPALNLKYHGSDNAFEKSSSSTKSSPVHRTPHHHQNSSGNNNNNNHHHLDHHHSSSRSNSRKESRKELKLPQIVDTVSHSMSIDSRDHHQLHHSSSHENDDHHQGDDFRPTQQSHRSLVIPPSLRNSFSLDVLPSVQDRPKSTTNNTQNHENAVFLSNTTGKLANQTNHQQSQSHFQQSQSQQLLLPNQHKINKRLLPKELRVNPQVVTYSLNKYKEKK